MLNIEFHIVYANKADIKRIPHDLRIHSRHYVTTNKLEQIQCKLVNGITTEIKNRINY